MVKADAVIENKTVENIERLPGMSANLCVESHLRELLEQGFEVIVVKDATAAAKTANLGDGYAAALTNVGFIANAVVTTEDAIAAMAAAYTVTTQRWRSLEARLGWAGASPSLELLAEI